MIDGARSDIEDHVIFPDFVDRDDTRGNMRGEFLRHDGVDRKHDVAAERPGLVDNVARGRDKVTLVEGLSDRHALRREEGIGHGATDDQCIDLG